MYELMWNWGPDKIKRGNSNIIGNKHVGGIGMPHIANHHEAFKISCLNRHEEKEQNDDWRQLVYSLVPLNLNVFFLVI